MERLIVNYASREKRFASIRNKHVDKIVFDRPEHRSLVGNIYLGTITKVLPGMNAAFIDIGIGKNAYLHRNVLPSFVSSQEKGKNISSFVHQGERMLVQVDKDATGTKGPKVTGIIEIPGKHLIYIPNGHFTAVSKKITDDEKKNELKLLGNHMKAEQEGIIFRTSSGDAAESVILDEFNHLRLKYDKLQQKTGEIKKPGLLFQKDQFSEMVAEEASKMNMGEVIVDDLSLKKKLDTSLNVKVTYYNGKENVFSAFKVEHEIDKALKHVVWLDNGAYLIFDETEALTIIDVNTGKYSGKADYQETVFKTNELAAKEIIRQLRLRDIGGIVLIDFIDMKQEQDKEKIQKTIEQELARDEKRTKIVGWTKLGIMQLTRKRTKAAISETMQAKCPVCHGTGRILSPETIAFRLERELLEHRHSEYEAVLVETTKEVQEVLLGPNQTYKETLEDLLHFKIYFSILPSIEHYYVLAQFGAEQEILVKAGETSHD
ncbi:Rne/Rng family ribonuclease [Neobacillus mesonae]|uniref:Rne/Rng family ribonuclease n=1 Tax=Neobacillus mesonae TaxID=1193713 RepID=UPI00204130AA|nr:Rne/Rng family ribonuclease [Neobacillus mesonae]MCM3568407.1 Rne/Rng family ribonuclease [Neobacillus mesonae]